MISHLEISFCSSEICIYRSRAAATAGLQLLYSWCQSLSPERERDASFQFENGSHVKWFKLLFVSISKEHVCKMGSMVFNGVVIECVSGFHIVEIRSLEDFYVNSLVAVGTVLLWVQIPHLYPCV